MCLDLIHTSLDISERKEKESETDESGQKDLVEYKYCFDSSAMYVDV